MIALRILVVLARAIQRQIGNTGPGGCNGRPLEKINFSSFVCSLRHRTGKVFSLETSSTNVLRLTKVQNPYVLN